MESHREVRKERERGGERRRERGWVTPSNTRVHNIVSLHRFVLY